MGLTTKQDSLSGHLHLRTHRTLPSTTEHRHEIRRSLLLLPVWTLMLELWRRHRRHRWSHHLMGQRKTHAGKRATSHERWQRHTTHRWRRQLREQVMRDGPHEAAAAAAAVLLHGWRWPIPERWHGWHRWPPLLRKLHPAHALLCRRHRSLVHPARRRT